MDEILKYDYSFEIFGAVLFCGTVYYVLTFESVCSMLVVFSTFQNNFFGKGLTTICLKSAPYLSQSECLTDT